MTRGQWYVDGPGVAGGEGSVLLQERQTLLAVHEAMVVGHLDDAVLRMIHLQYLARWRSTTVVAFLNRGITLGKKQLFLSHHGVLTVHHLKEVQLVPPFVGITPNVGATHPTHPKNHSYPYVSLR